MFGCYWFSQKHWHVFSSFSILCVMLEWYTLALFVFRVLLFLSVLVLCWQGQNNNWQSIEIHQVNYWRHCLFFVEKANKHQQKMFFFLFFLVARAVICIMRTMVQELVSPRYASKYLLIQIKNSLSISPPSLRECHFMSHFCYVLLIIIFLFIHRILSCDPFVYIHFHVIFSPSPPLYVRYNLVVQVPLFSFLFGWYFPCSVFFSSQVVRIQ